MRLIIAIISFSIAIFISPIRSYSQNGKAFAVVELFTSEGCNSCPPADKILSEISAEARKNNQEIYCLAYHVDYWNRLGWKDPYSKLQFTQRQENYSRVLPSKELYTPQMVVNGKIEFTGSKKEKSTAALEAALKMPAAVQLSIQIDSTASDTIYISWKLSKTDKNNVLQIAFTESGLVSNVIKGENAGKILKHDHVVRSFTAVNNPGSTGQVRMVVKGRDAKVQSELIAFLQHKQHYGIAAATGIKNPGKK